MNTANGPRVSGTINNIIASLTNLLFQTGNKISGLVFLLPYFWGGGGVGGGLWLESPQKEK